MVKSYKILSAILFFLMIYAQFISAQSFEVVINSTRDCYTISTQPDSNHNGNYLVIENDSIADTYAYGLVYFDLSSVPANAIIQQAFLMLYRFDDLSNAGVRIGLLHPPSWDETTVTYNNMPYADPPPAYLSYDLPPTNTYSNYDVTTYVLDWGPGGGYVNNGFQLYTEQDSTGAIFYAREAGNSYIPKLKIIYTLPQAPDPPVLVSPPNNAIDLPTTIVFEWDSANGADSYTLEYGTSSTNNIIYGITQTHFQINGLDGNTIYAWDVQAVNDVGATTSDIWLFTTALQTPPPPVLVSPPNAATGVPINPTIFTWNASPRANYYRLQVSANSAFTDIVFDQNNLYLTSRQVSGLLNGTMYYWKVNATNAAGAGGWSLIRKFTTVVPAPIAPAPYSPLNGSTSIEINPTTFTWSSSPEAMSYGIQIATDVNFSNPVVYQTDINDTSYQVDNLQGNTTYFWRLNASNEGGTSDWTSPPWNFITELPSGIQRISSDIPKDFALYQNYPNPFNPTTRINFSIPQFSFVTIKLYDLLGNEVKTLLEEELGMGNYQFDVNASELPSGIYYYRMIAGEKVFVKKMILLK